jgi:hypothetical protein
MIWVEVLRKADILSKVHVHCAEARSVALPACLQEAKGKLGKIMKGEKKNLGTTMANECVCDVDDRDDDEWACGL